MTSNSQTISVNNIVQQINEHITELGGRATPTAVFSDLEVDSLICVEIAVFISQRYGIQLEEYEVSDSGNFTELAELISQRRASRGDAN